MVAYVHPGLPLADREAQTDQAMNRIVWHVSPAPPFTDKQGQYLQPSSSAYAAVSSANRHAEADMQRHFQVSPPSVHQMVLTLERAGLIRRTPGARAQHCKILVEPEDLPVLR